VSASPAPVKVQRAVLEATETAGLHVGRQTAPNRAGRVGRRELGVGVERRCDRGTGEGLPGRTSYGRCGRSSLAQLIGYLAHPSDRRRK
jgi:hypothetical protein